MSSFANQILQKQLSSFQGVNNFQQIEIITENNQYVLFKRVLKGDWGTNPISQPIFFEIPLHSAQIPFPFLICDFFPHSQWPNPGPSGFNPIFPGQKQANPFPILPLQELLYNQQCVFLPYILNFKI